jgi:hypothetical protein
MKLKNLIIIGLMLASLKLLQYWKVFLTTTGKFLMKKFKANQKYGSFRVQKRLVMMWVELVHLICFSNYFLQNCGFNDVGFFRKETDVIIPGTDFTDTFGPPGFVVQPAPVAAPALPPKQNPTPK